MRATLEHALVPELDVDVDLGPIANAPRVVLRAGEAFVRREMTVDPGGEQASACYTQCTFVDLGGVAKGGRLMRCRVCGCTDGDACIDGSNGETCSWAAPGLCSFCAPDWDLEAEGGEEPLVKIFSDAEAAAFLRERA